MSKCPNKGKTNILYYALYCKKSDFVYFYPRPSGYICHSVRPSLPPSVRRSQKIEIQISQLWD